MWSRGLIKLAVCLSGVAFASTDAQAGLFHCRNRASTCQPQVYCYGQAYQSPYYSGYGYGYGGSAQGYGYQQPGYGYAQGYAYASGQPYASGAGSVAANAPLAGSSATPVSTTDPRTEQQLTDHERRIHRLEQTQRARTPQ